MPIKFTRHESGVYFVSTWEGKVSDDELISSYNVFFESGEWKQGMYELADLSSVDFSQVTYSGLIGLAKWAEKFYSEQQTSGIKTAIFIPPGNSAAEAIIYNVWTTDSPEQVMIFRNRDQAHLWLLE